MVVSVLLHSIPPKEVEPRKPVQFNKSQKHTNCSIYCINFIAHSLNWNKLELCNAHTHGLTNLMVTSLRTENGRSVHPVGTIYNARVKQEILVNIDTTCQK